MGTPPEEERGRNRNPTKVFWDCRFCVERRRRATLRLCVRLLTAHKILISTALALALLLSLRSTFLYWAHHVRTDAVLALVALGVAFLLGWYLRQLQRR